MSDPATPDAPPSLPKADPETLVLRGSPRRITRFRRGVIIAAAAASATGIAGVTWFALQRPSLIAHGAGQVPDLGAPQPPDALANAPKSYGDVPRLGPPLPGDLGKPILDRQRALGISEDDAGAADRAVQAAEAERQRAAAELQAARQSGVMITVAGKPAAPVPAPDPARATPPEPVRDSGIPKRTPDPRGAANASGDVNPHPLTAPASPNMLSAGTILSASLITGLNSDLPGNVIAQVTAPAYDSVTGRTVLIPQGSRILGSYDNVVAFGQQRALVVWQRIILPDGSSVRIDNWPASDMQGYAGLADRIDRHTWQLLKGVGLSTLLGVGTEIGFAGESDLVEAIRESAQQSGARAGDQLVRKNLDVPPTIRVRPGWPLTVIVHKDLVLPPWKGI